MKTLLFQFNELPNLTNNENWRRGVEKDIVSELNLMRKPSILWDYNGGNRVSVVIGAERAEELKCALHNLHGARLMEEMSTETIG